jgi:hypothetical protein
MTPRSHTLNGLQTVLRTPSLVLTEIAWRWTFGIAVVVLLTFSTVEFLDTLPVGRGEFLLFRSGRPLLILRAIQHILRGSLPRAAALTFLLAVMLSLAWIALASVGRATTLNNLLQYFRQRGMDLPSLSTGPMLRSLAGLNFLRVAMTAAAALAWLGTFIIASRVDSPTRATVFLWILLMLVAVTWSRLNWWLSTAPIFVAARTNDALKSLAAVIDLFTQHRWSFFAIAAWFNIGHVLAFALASSVATLALVLAYRFPGLALTATVIVLFIYLAVVDFLHVARIAAYMSLLTGGPSTPVSPIKSSPELGPGSGLDRRARVDPDELILSDLPLSPS